MTRSSATAPPWELRFGPTQRSPAARRETAQNIAQALAEHHGTELLVVGVYGSTARGDDAAFSDLEMLALLASGAPHQVDEWVEDGLKVKLHRYQLEFAKQEAQRVGPEHCLERARYTHAVAIAGEPAHLEALAQLASNPCPTKVQTALRGLLLGELFEIVGKLRNRGAAVRMLPVLAIRFAEFGAMALGLATGATVVGRVQLLGASLEMTGCPSSHKELVTLIQSGKLDDIQKLLLLLEDGLVEWLDWAAERKWASPEWSQRPSHGLRSAAPKTEPTTGRPL
jgi:kanamycin nucleotidyltransferase